MSDEKKVLIPVLDGTASIEGGPLVVPYYTEGFCTKCDMPYWYIDPKRRGLKVVCTTCHTEQNPTIWRQLVVLDTPGECPDCHHTVYPEEFSEVTFLISPTTGKMERHLCGLKKAPVVYHRPD